MPIAICDELLSKLADFDFVEDGQASGRVGIPAVSRDEEASEQRRRSLRDTEAQRSSFQNL